MSIKTHRALSVASETDNGTLNMAGWGKICKLFFPFSETSGTVFKDGVNGLTITDASSAFTVENAVTMHFNTAAPTSGVVPVIGDNDALIMLVRDSNGSGSGGYAVGTAAADGMRISLIAGSGVAGYDEGVGAPTSTASNYTEAQNKVSIEGITKTDLLLTHYASYGGAAMATKSVDISSLDSDMQNGDFINIGETFDSHQYGFALFVFPDGLPSDVETAIAWFGAQWLAGNKTIEYEPWRSLL